MKKLASYFVALSGVAVLTAGMSALDAHFNPATISLVFLLFILFLATLWGSKPAALGSIAAMLCLNYFFLPPYGTLMISEPENWVALVTFLVVAITAGQLSAKVKWRAEEAERLYAELQAAFEQASQAEALRRSEKLKSSLLDAVTHDLRTPLTSIKASATTLLDNERESVLDAEGRQEFLEIIDEETDRLNKFIEGMVGLAKIEAHALQGRKSWGSADEIINNALERAKLQMGSRNIVMDVERDLPSIFVDSSSIAEVVYTLLDNAAKYSPTDSRIRISAKRAEDEMIEIGVEDEGRGIAPEMRDKVFNKFFRAESEDIHSSSTGLGLGLAIARGIVESQGGRIWITDGADGFRTRAVFVIPVGDEEK